MKAEQRMVIEFLNGNKQQITPFYQRKYRWGKSNCERLFNDVMKIGESKIKPNYFLGVIFHTKPKYPKTAISHIDIIDGQQRVTTLTLFACALADYLKENPVEDLPNYIDLIEDYVINRNYNDEEYFKLRLQEKDDAVFQNLVFNIVNDDTIKKQGRSRIIKNFNYFKNLITSENIHTLYRGFLKLKIMDMSLEDDDNAQEVFETINGTGLNLRQCEQVKNYLFMGLNDKGVQKRMDSLYWRDMEEICDAQSDIFFDRFIKTFLITKIDRTFNNRDIFEEFKLYLNADFDSSSDTKAINFIKELSFVSKYYFKITLPEIYEDDSVLKELFMNINVINKIRLSPFILRLYDEYATLRLSKEEFVCILKLLESYSLRRNLCELSGVTGTDSFFASLYSKLDKNNLYESLKMLLCSLTGGKRFPTDKEMIFKLKQFDFYNYNNSAWVLCKIENFNHKEKVILTKDITKEHIMPQTLSQQWKEGMSEKELILYKEYVHTIGNITLTGYNANLGNKSFEDKKTMENGYCSSKINLTKELCKYDCWGIDEISQRTDMLTQQIISIWKYPHIDEIPLSIFKEESEVPAK